MFVIKIHSRYSIKFSVTTKQMQRDQFYSEILDIVVGWARTNQRQEMSEIDDRSNWHTSMIAAGAR